MNFWEIIFLFFAFQAILVAIYFLLKKKGDRLANGILSAFLLIFALNLIYNVGYWSKLLFTPQNVWAFGLLAMIWVLYPPLIYLYCKRVLTGKGLTFRDSVHIIPLLAAFWAFSPVLLLNSDEKLDILRNGLVGNYIRFAPYVSWMVVLIMVFYVLFTYFSFRNYKAGRNKKRWFQWLLGSFSCYVLAMFVYFVLSRLQLITTGHDYFIMYTIIFFIGSISYFGIMQPDVFSGLSMDSVLPFGKYRKTGLSESHSLELKTQLLTYLEESKPYLKNDLRLGDLANELNLSVHHTSQVINEHFDCNFFDLINSYRIREAKRLLIEANNLNITDIIFSSGFNNRVSFYKAFKKQTGKTPGNYRAENI